nr:hypothetical protein [Crocinitomix algicola]
MFERYEMHVTWATVGLLGHNSIDELINYEDRKKIPYKNSAYSPFPLSYEKYSVFNPDKLLAPTLVQRILNSPLQELGSHTYSHFYTLEEGVTLDDFKIDLKRMTDLGLRFNTRFETIVFPRNQVNTATLEVLGKEGYLAYRGNQENRFWKNSQYAQESIFKKTLRVVDAFFPISRTKSYQLSELKTHHGMVNIPANRFLRPPTSLKWLERRKIRRIKREMHQAAKKGTVYHLWWHPHNFCEHPKLAQQQLEEILAYYHVLAKRYTFLSLTMKEIADHVKT